MIPYSILLMKQKLLNLQLPHIRVTIKPSNSIRRVNITLKLPVYAVYKSAVNYCCSALIGSSN